MDNQFNNQQNYNYQQQNNSQYQQNQYQQNQYQQQGQYQQNQYQQPNTPKKKHTWLIVVIIVITILLTSCCCIFAFSTGVVKDARFETNFNSKDELETNTSTDTTYESDMNKEKNDVIQPIESDAEEVLTIIEDIEQPTLEITESKIKEESSIEPAYIDTDIIDMFSLLKNDSITTSNQYQNANISIVGYVGYIDELGQCIGVVAEPNSMENVFCYFRNQEQKDIASNLQIGDKVCVKGNVYNVGEFSGFSLDIDVLEK